MPTTETDAPQAHEPDLQIAVTSGGLIEKLTTQRGTTRLSLADLEAKVTHYPKEIRTATITAQRFFVEHCEGNVERFMGIARNALGVDRSSGYFSNWLKGFYFLTGGGKLKESSKGYTEWLNFCGELARYQARLRGEGRTLLTPTIRAIEANIAEIHDLDNPCRIGGLAGATGTQKTEGVKYVVNKRGGFPNANYFDCTEGLGVYGLKRGIGALFQAKVGNGTKAGVLDRAIAENLNPERALFLDNIQRAVSPDDESAVVDWLIRLQEWKNFPLYFTFTKGFRESLKKNTFLEQLVGRIGGMNEILVLNDYPSTADLRVFARHHHLAESAIEDYLLPWSKELGRIRVVVRRLWRAKQCALSDGKDRILLDHLKEADQWIPPAQLDVDEGGAL